MLSLKGSFPSKGEVIDYNNLKITVTDIKKRRIIRLHIKKLPLEPTRIMPNTFIDRFNLRRLQRLLYKSRFEQQNVRIGNYLNIDSKWLHISRLNYHYIYSNPMAYWPQWAISTNLIQLIKTHLPR